MTDAARRSALARSPRAGLAGASNAWAAAPARTAAGGTLLANDPHLALSGALDLVSRADGLAGTGGVIGGTIPGIPAVIASGGTRTSAGGLTSAYLDDQDVYVEKLDPDEPRATT